MQQIQRQFGRQAAQYSSSRSHAGGDSLDAVRRLVGPGPYRLGLDLATGTGFTAFAIAPCCTHTIALDMTVEMLTEARRLADVRGPDAIRYLLGDAEALPFAGGSFDLITCRSSAHHFPHVPRFLGEVARLLRPGGVFVLSDPITPEDSALAALMDHLETERDPTHVHDLSLSQWRRVIEAAGMLVDAVELTKIHHVFHEWVHRAGTSPEAIEQLRPSFTDPLPEVRDAFRIQAESDGIHFAFDTAVIRALR